MRTKILQSLLNRRISRKWAALILLLGFPLLAAAAESAERPPKTKDAFLAAVRTAYETRDIRQIHELTWEKGVSNWDRKMLDQTLPLMLKSIDEVEKLTYVPIPADFMEQHVAFGKRTDPTHQITGAMELSFKTQKKGAASQTTTMLLPYAVINGDYYLVTGKTTDLGWKGPKDKQLGVTVTGEGWDKATIHIKYNASGVNVERNQKAMSSLFVGQYIEEVTVASDSDDAEVTLSLRDGGEQIYESQPLKGKGEIHYKRDSAGTLPK